MILKTKRLYIQLSHIQMQRYYSIDEEVKKDH